MKKRLLSLFVVLCVALTCTSFTANAEISSNDVFGKIEGATQINNVMWFVSTQTPVEGTGALGGKTGYTSVTTNASGEQFLNLRVQKANIDKTYIVSSFNVYGNVTTIIPKIRFSGSNQAVVGSTVATSELTANVWNSVKLVYNTTTREAYVLVNGKKIRTTTFEPEFTDTTDTYIDFRMLFSTNKTINFADIIGYKTNSEETLIGTIDYNKQEIKDVFWFVNGPEVTASTSAIGGKSSEDLHSVVTTPNADTFINFRATGHLADTDKKYIVTSANFYGNESYLVFRVRYAAGQMNIFVSNAGEYLLADRWNNVKVVYNRADKQTYLLINGKNPGKYLDYSNTSQYIESQYFDCEAYLKSISADTSQVPDFRIIFERNKTYNIDDIEVYKTDIEPTAQYKRLSGEKGDAGNSVVILSGAADFTAQGGNMKSADLKNWSAATAVDADEYVAVENSFEDIGGTTIGKTYNYVKCLDANAIKEFTSTGFQQGGKPYKDGKETTNACYDEENVFGSGMTMELVGSGVNTSTSVQSFYKYSWPNANAAYSNAYLVMECDFAFPAASGNLVPTAGLALGTNGGKGIGSAVNGEFCYQNRINHYRWIYDIYAGTYDIYVNGKLVHNDIAPDAGFISGERKEIRCIVSSKCESDGGTSEKLYGLYMENLKLYECNSLSGFAEPIYIPGAKISTLPVTKASVPVSEILDKFNEADRENVTVFFNRGYKKATEEDSVNAGQAVVMTKTADNKYDYARLVLAPDSDSDYAIETLNLGQDGSVSAKVFNYASKRAMTVIIAGYDEGDDFVVAGTVSATVNTSSGVTANLPANSRIKKVKVFVWENLSSLKPLGNAINIKE